MTKAFIIFFLLYYCFILAQTLVDTLDQLQTDEPISECDLLKQQCKIKYLNADPEVFSYELSSEQIDKMCSKLKMADTCLAEYTNLCTVPIDYLEKLAQGYLGLVMQMCHNETYKQDYQTVKACQSGIQSDYVQCELSSQNHTKAITDKIKQIMIVNQSQDSLTQTSLETCCTIFKYRKCTNKRNLDKCGLKSTQFVNYSFEVFHRAVMLNCAKYSKDLISICVQNI